MDHLILPNGVDHYITVPCQCPEPRTAYDGGDFYTFPARQTWTDDQVTGDFGLKKPPEIEAFFQRWLFFGTLTEVTRLMGLVIKVDDFVTVRDGARVITTRVLPALIKEQYQSLNEALRCDCPATTLETGHALWKGCQGEEPCPVAEARARHKADYDSAYEILRFVASIVRRFTWNPDVVASPPTWPVAPAIALSITALTFALARAVGDMANNVGINLLGGTTVLEERLIGAGWCPLRIRRAANLGVDGLYYVAANPNVDDLGHIRCRATACVAKNVDVDKYVTKHVSDHCRCDFVEVSEVDLLALIKSGKTPLIRWVDLADGMGFRLSISEYRPSDAQPENQRKSENKAFSAEPIGTDHQYVAISHVWADGLGNPHFNALPRCRIALIQNQVDAVDFLGKVPGGSGPMAFWMDTLCVPVKPEHDAFRKKSIFNMRHTYEQAGTVLVLDSALQSMALSSPPADKCVTLYQSGWESRLWTFQESFLGRDVHFQFDGGAQDNRALSKESATFLQAMKAEGRHYNFSTDATSGSTAGLNILRQFMLGMRSGDHPPDWYRQNALAPLTSGIWQRRTTRKADEILCVATMLDMDMAPFLDVSSEDSSQNVAAPGPLEKAQRDQLLADCRMERFVLQLGVYPAGSIFRRVPRLSREGFRWAQRSFLGHPLLNDSGVEWALTPILKMDQGGFALKVVYHGLILQPNLAAPIPIGERRDAGIIVVGWGERRFQTSLFNPNSDTSYLEHMSWKDDTFYCLVFGKDPETVDNKGEGVPVMLGSVMVGGHWQSPRFERCGTARAVDKEVTPDFTACYAGKETEWFIR